MAIVLHPYIMGAPPAQAFPKGNRAHLQLGRTSGWASRSWTGIRESAAVWGRPDPALRGRSDAKIGGLDPVVGPQLVRAGRVDHPALAQHMHIVDQLEGERGVLLHEQDG